MQLKPGIVVQYSYGDPLVSEGLMISQILENSAVRMVAMPRCELPENMPKEVPFSPEPKAGHWSWAKPFDTNG